MFVAFFESIKYVGHLLPIAFLRIYMGYYYFQLAHQKFQGDFLFRPRLAESVAEVLPHLKAWPWYKYFAESFFIHRWQTASFLITGLELAVGLSFLLGYVVRPMALVAALMSINTLVLFNGNVDDLHRNFLAIHIALAWVGAGRCLGFDYYFFKRRRGIWW